MRLCFNSGYPFRRFVLTGSLKANGGSTDPDAQSGRTRTPKAKGIEIEATFRTYKDCPTGPQGESEKRPLAAKAEQHSSAFHARTRLDSSQSIWDGILWEKVGLLSRRPGCPNLSAPCSDHRMSTAPLLLRCKAMLYIPSDI